MKRTILTPAQVAWLNATTLRNKALFGGWQMTATPPEAALPSPEPPAPTTSTAPVVEKPWGDDANFDAEKAWKLIEGLRVDKEKLSAREFLTDTQKADLAELERLKEASKTELERAQEAASQSAERIQAITRRAVEAEVKSAAAAFTDPSDAAAFLDLSKYGNEDGEIDTEAIASDLAALLESKPHLGKPAGPADPRAPKPNPAQGAGGTGSSPTREALIAEATSKGDWKTVVALQNQKLLKPGTA